MIAVTGCLGFIGGHVCERLIEMGYDVAGLDRWDGDGEVEKGEMFRILRAQGGGFRYHHGDVTDGAFVRSVLRQDRIDAIIHLAGHGGVRASWERVGRYMAVNVGGTATVLGAAAECGVGRVLLASSSSVYGTVPAPFIETADQLVPLSPYGLSKLVMEQTAQWYAPSHHLRVAALRYFTVYGPRQRRDMALAVFARAWSEGRPAPVFGALEQRRDFTYVGDVAHATLLTMHAMKDWEPGRFEVLNIGTGEPSRLARVLELLRDALGVEGPIEMRRREPGDLQVTWADRTKAGELVGWYPTVGVETGVRAFADWWTRQPRALRAVA